MGAAPLDFAAERELIGITDDPEVVLDWVREYREHARTAAADDDGPLGSRIEELIEFALDHAANLKAARLRRAAAVRPRLEGRPMEPTPPRIRASVDDGAERTPRPPASVPQSAAPASAPVVPPVRAGAEDARRREEARRRAEEVAREKAAAEEAEAARVRADEAELRQLQERAAQARARRDAALAATARIEAESRRAAEQEARVRRARARAQAAREAEEAERAAAQAEAAASRAAKGAGKPPSTPARAGSAGGADVPAGPVVDRSHRAHQPVQEPEAPDEELTPLALLFREHLGGLVDGSPKGADAPRREGAAAVTPRSRADLPTVPAGAPSRPPPPPARSAAFNAARATTRALSPTSAAPPPPPPPPVDEPPPLTGADLASYRSWLGVSQRALATKLGVEQSSVCRGEGKPTTVLPASVRLALHKAMAEPRADVAAPA